MQVKELLQDVEYSRHLSEDKHFMPFGVQVLEQHRQALELAAVVLYQVLVREEQYVGELQRLVHITMRHQLLVQESFISLLLLMLSIDFGRYEIDCVSHGFRYDKLVMPNSLLKNRNSLKRSYYKLLQYLTVLVGKVL